MPDHYFHYTSRQAAQEILAAGRFEVGRSGRIFLSLDIYSEGAVALDRLALIGKAAEMVAIVESATVVDPSPVNFVGPMYHPVDGRLIRHGGGTEVTTNQPIPAAATAWLAVAAP